VTPRRRFAARVRLVLAVLLLASLVLVGQPVSFAAYKVGLGLMVVVVLLGFTFNNIAPHRTARETVVPLFVTVIVVGAVFGTGIVLAPILTELGG